MRRIRTTIRAMALTSFRRCSQCENSIVWRPSIIGSIVAYGLQWVKQYEHNSPAVFGYDSLQDAKPPGLAALPTHDPHTPNLIGTGSSPCASADKFLRSIARTRSR